MADILNFPMLGRLEIVETYAYYDQPVLFSCKNSAGRLYLVVAADENEENETWLFAGMSEERLRLIRSGSIDLHDAFADPEDGFLVRGIVFHTTTKPDSNPTLSDPIKLLRTYSRYPASDLILKLTHSPH